MSYNAKVYMKQGGDELVVNAGGAVALGGSIDVNGGKITKEGTQADHIADATDTVTPAAFNAVLKALEDVGILKSS